MKPGEGGHPGRGRSWPRPREQAACAVAYLGFLLRVLTRSKSALGFPIRPATRLFLATLHGSSGSARHTLRPQAVEVEHTVIPTGPSQEWELQEKPDHPVRSADAGPKLEIGVGPSSVRDRRLRLRTTRPRRPRARTGWGKVRSTREMNLRAHVFAL